jgi:hypothetical protein
VSTDEEDFEEPQPPRRSVAASIAVLQAQVRLLAWMVKHNLVSKHEFTPVKLLVYGATALVLSTMIGALIAFVIRQQN